jgi:hypothetical protein
MLSLWPAGLPTNAKGTIEWAGGEIDWNSPYMTNGYYAARFQEVTVECYDPPPQAQIKGKKTYRYTDEAGTNNTVAITDDEVILGSLLGTGEEPGEASKSGSSSQATDTSVAMVPGGNPGGGAGNQIAETSTTAAANAGTPQETASSGGGGGGSSFEQFGASGSTAGSSGAASSVQPGLGCVGRLALATVIAVVVLIAL